MLALEPDDPRSIETGGRRYRVLARIGSGGMGVVYFGRSTGGRGVAIKLVHAELAENHEFRDRLSREVAAVQAVGGGFTAPVVDADPRAEIPWLATEFLAAVSVREAVQENGALPLDAVWRIAAGIAEALQSIHAAGVVHRDLTPSNVLLTADGPRVIDFGISRLADATTITRAGDRAGSPGFMSPEQVAGAPIGFPSDIFTFGATLAYACTGAEPFGAGSWHEKMYRVQRESPRLDGIADAALRTLIAACMDRDPSRRPTSHELAEQLAGVMPQAWTSLLPPEVAAEIVRRAGEAANPPLPAGRPRGRTSKGRGAHRRTLLLGAAGIAVLAAGVGIPGAAWYLNRTEPAAERRTTPTPTRTQTAAPTPTATATPVARTPSQELSELTFSLDGDGRIPSLTYTVNGRSTTLTNVELPWEKTIVVPTWPRVSWELAFRHRGTVVYSVEADGYTVIVGVNHSTRDIDVREDGVW